MNLTVRRPAVDTVARSYQVAGVPCIVKASSAVLEVVDDTYGAYRVDAPRPGAFTVHAAREDHRFVVVDSEGHASAPSDEPDVAFTVLERLAQHVTEELARQGVFAVHAAALVHEGQAVAISGRSHSGKTTLALALVSRGLGLLSDEFALSAPDARTILPFRRGLHVRPGTPELIAELAFLKARPCHPLSGGFQWTLRSDELARVFPSCLAEPAPLGHLLLLEPRGGDGESRLEPIPKGVAVVELVRSTTAAATNLNGATKRLAKLVDGARCARLRPGRLESSVELLLEWLALDDA